jgi:GWxTD domain-containing protein
LEAQLKFVSPQVGRFLWSSVGGLVGMLLGVGGAAAQGTIPVVVDHATFRLSPDHDSCYTEFYYGVSRNALTFEFQEPDSVWQASFEAALEVTDTLGRPVDTVIKLIGTRVTTEAETRRRDVKIIDVLHLYLPPGRYRAHLSVTDAASGDTGGDSDDLVVHDMNRTDSLLVSDLQLAYRIDNVGDDADAAQNVKVKNGYFVEPNPSRIYAPDDSLLLFYAELYNLEPDPPVYQVHIWVLDRFGGIVRDLGLQSVERPGESALLVYGLKLAGLAQGERHMLALEVEQGDQVVTARDSFWLGIGPADKAAGAQKEFTEEDAKLNLQFISYIATADEIKEYNALGLEGKQRFLDQFWGKRDPDPSTPVNEFLQEHIARFIVANDRFSRSMMERNDGWDTDRGRVLILYGEPSRVIEEPSSVGTWGWERWEYDTIEGGVFFIFLDWKNLGDYRLMHSNKRGERYDPEWQQKIDIEGIDILSR